MARNSPTAAIHDVFVSYRLYLLEIARNSLSVAAIHDVVVSSIDYIFLEWQETHKLLQQFTM